MTALEIILIIIGLVFILGSFLIAEKLSPSELKHVAELSSKEIDEMLKRELEKAKGRIENTVDETIDESVMTIERKMDKEANEKIMAISEYSDTVLDSINKSHNEVMFLYSMLNDKHEELVNCANEMSEMAKEARQQMEETILEAVQRQEEPEVEEIPEPQVEESVEEDGASHNDRILEMYRQGRNQMEIAKELGLGVGEVKLVIDLYQGE